MPFKELPPLYSVWMSMRRRCMDRNFKQWFDYGGRGIKVCERWSSYANFESDMGTRPPGYSLDRIDNNGDYEPSNCRWATRTEQSRNQRRAVYVTIEGQRHRAIELAEMTGMKADTIVARAARGMSYAEVVAPVRYVVPNITPEGIAKSAKARREKPFCVNGHPRTADNLMGGKWGGACRACHRERQRLRYHRNKERAR